MYNPTYPLFPIFAFLGFVLALVPLPWHMQAWNSGTCFYMMWAALACLNQFVNSVVWASNVLNPAPIWCDISIRIILGASVGLPAASLCINRRLYQIATAHSAGFTRAEKKRAILIDTLICVLFPLVFIAVQYVVQGHRFDIFEDIGCYPALYNTLPTYFLSGMWPIVIGLMSAVYCVLSLRCFVRRRLEFNQFLSSNKSLTVSRYFRLMALATTEICCTTPLAVFTIYLNLTATPVGPWRSWSDTHFAFSRVEEYPALLWRANFLTVLSMEFSRWLNPWCSFIFFAFFGFAEEARKHYRAAFWSLLKPVGLRPKVNPSLRPVTIGQFKPKAPVVNSTVPSLPTYSPPSSASFISEEKHAVSFSSSVTNITDDTRVSTSHTPSSTSLCNPDKLNRDSFENTDSVSPTPVLSNPQSHVSHELSTVNNTSDLILA